MRRGERVAKIARYPAGTDRSLRRQAGRNETRRYETTRWQFAGTDEIAPVRRVRNRGFIWRRVSGRNRRAIFCRARPSAAPDQQDAKALRHLYPIGSSAGALQADQALWVPSDRPLRRKPDTDAPP